MTTRDVVIAAAKEAGFGTYTYEALTMFERFYTIVANQTKEQCAALILATKEEVK